MSTVLLIIAAILVFNALYVGWLTWSTRNVRIDRPRAVRRARGVPPWR